MWPHVRTWRRGQPGSTSLASSTPASGTVSNRSAFATVVFRDPDNIQLELFAVVWCEPSRDKSLRSWDFDANPNVDAAAVHTLAKCDGSRRGLPLCLIGDSGAG